MSQIDDMIDRLRMASDLPSTLAGAYNAFDAIRLAIRGREDPASGMLAALAMSVAIAIDGRDAITRAPSLPLFCLSPADTASPAGDSPPEVQDLVRELARLAGTLAWQLNLTAQAAGLAGDREACTQAAACAREIHELLTGASG